MHSYNPCLFLFSAQVACLSTAAPTEYLLVSVAWFACSCACFCVNCVNGSSQRGTRILVKCAHWKATVGLSVGREERTTTRTHSHRPTIECSCVSCRLRIRSSAPLSGSFGLLPLPGRSTNQTEDTERAAFTANGCCLSSLQHWSSWTGRRPQVPGALLRYTHAKNMHTNLAPPTVHRWLVLNWILIVEYIQYFEYALALVQHFFFVGKAVRQNAETTATRHQEINYYLLQLLTHA